MKKISETLFFIMATVVAIIGAYIYFNSSTPIDAIFGAIGSAFCVIAMILRTLKK